MLMLKYKPSSYHNGQDNCCKITSKTIILLSLILITTNVMSLKTDIEKPVHINADSVLFNKAKGYALYEGNVIIAQGTLEIKASRIEISAPNNEISRITAQGKPVSFKQKMDDGKIAKGQANKVIYRIKEKQLSLDGNAIMSQNSDKFSSNHIEYSIKTGELKAGNKKNKGKSRVNVIFYPTNKAN